MLIFQNSILYLTMTLEISPSTAAPNSPSAESYWFIFDENKVLVHISENQVLAFPLQTDLQKFDYQIVNPLYLGKVAEFEAYGAEIKKEDLPIPENWEWRDLRSLMPMIESDWFWIAGKAFQFVNWFKTHQYCGQCGSPTMLKKEEKATYCQKCNLSFYPRVSPAVIVAIRKNDQILLAHALRFPQKFYSTLAGFVEAGESLEECLRREVREEVGIEIKNIQYFGSQPWAFPHSLMIGFKAEYESGEIKVDQTEIDHADWFKADNLPVRPNRFSIASQLIDDFVKNTPVFENELSIG